jgi:hypothetical protein
VSRAPLHLRNIDPREREPRDPGIATRSEVDLQKRCGLREEPPSRDIGSLQVCTKLLRTKLVVELSEHWKDRRVDPCPGSHSFEQRSERGVDWDGPHPVGCLR